MLRERPQVVFVLDTKKEHIAVTEANKLGIPVIAVVDTNCDPDVIDYVIPGNDDAIRSGELMCRVINEAVQEGQLMRSKRGDSVQTPEVTAPEKEVEQEEAKKAAAAAFQERERKIASEITATPETQTQSEEEKEEN